jgi:TP901 family phage tail tape measure protein
MPEENLVVGIDARGAVTGATQYNGAVNSMTSTNAVAQTGMMALKSAFIGLFAVVGGGMVFRKVTKLTGEFEEVLAQVEGVTGATTRQMQAMEDVARELGATTRHTATNAGEGMLNLSRAGFEVAESQKMIKSTLTLATAGVIDLGESSEITANAIRQFKLESEDATRVADVFVNTANSANTNVRELAQGMSYAGPIAGNLGISIEETAGAIGTLSNAGIKGSRAGAGLRMIFTRLINPTTKAQKTLQKLGLTMEQVNPAEVGLIKAFENLAEAQMTAGESAKIFGTRQAVTGLVLSDNIETVKELTRENKNAGGTAERIAEIMRGTFNGAMLELKSTTQETALMMGDKLRPALKSVVRGATSFVRELAGIKVEGEKASLKIQALAGSVDVLVKSFALLATLSIPLVLKQIGVGLIALKGAILGIGGIMGSVLIPAVVLFATAYAGIKFGQWLAEFEPVAVGMQYMIQGIKSAFTILGLGVKAIWITIRETAKKYAINPVIKGFIWMQNQIGKTIALLLEQAEKITGKLASISGPYAKEVRKLRGKIISLKLAYRNSGVEAEKYLLKEKDLTEELAKATRKADKEVQKHIDTRNRAVKKIREQASAGEESNQRYVITDAFAGAVDETKKLVAGLLGMNKELKKGKLTAEEAGQVFELIKGEVSSIGSKLKNSVSPAVDFFKRTAKKTKEFFTGTKDAIKEGKDESEKFRMKWDDIKGTVASSMADIITTGQNLQSVVRNLANQLTRMAIQKAVMSAGTGGTEVPAGAKGLVAMANGGVVQAPTMALIGEKDEEAVMPLTRDREGRLGIRAEGSGGRKTEINIISPDAVGIEKTLLENPRLLQQMEQTKSQGYNL